MKTSWTEADFESLSWHDNHVHGLQIEVANPDHGTGHLILDLDHILEWLAPIEGRYRFRVAPATLTFLDVFGLRIDLDWAAVTAGMIPFSIGQIRREKAEYPGGFTWNWMIVVNWPKGAITFSGTKFTQVLRGEPIITMEPCLSIQERARISAV